MNITDVCKNIHLTSKQFLVLIALFVVGFVLLSFKLLTHSKTFDFNSEIKSLTTSVRTHFQKNIDYVGLNTDYVIEHNLAPKELIRTGKLFSKNFAEILVGKDIKGNPVAAFERTFALTYLNLNQKKCQALLLTEFPPEFGLSGISVLNDKLYEFSYGSQLSLPVSEKNAKLCCKNKNTVMLVFE